MSCPRFSFILPDNFVGQGCWASGVFGAGVRVVGLSLYELMLWWSFWGTTAKEGEERGYLPQKVIGQLFHLLWGQIAYIVLEETNQVSCL